MVFLKKSTAICSLINISKLDHLVLTVTDIEATCDFYSHTLGMRVISFGEGRKALKFGKQKFNLHQSGNEFEPRADKPTVGAIDLCLISDTPIDEIISQLKRQQIRIEAGPIERTGATGTLLSVYIRDPDKNLIEIANQI